MTRDDIHKWFWNTKDILVHNKAISQEDLDKALAEQKASKEKLGHILIKFGYITEDDLINSYNQVRKELSKYSKDLVKKKRNSSFK